MFPRIRRSFISVWPKFVEFNLSYDMSQTQYWCCSRSGDWSNIDAGECGSGGWWVVALVSALPAWFRFAQCIRRYK